MTQPDKSYSQLTIDGREEPITPGASPYAPLTGAQLDILRLVADHDITSTDAGRIVHAHRDPPCGSCRRGGCPYTATDGNEALKRLQERGFVRRVAAGAWTSRRT